MCKQHSNEKVSINYSMSSCVHSLHNKSYRMQNMMQKYATNLSSVCFRRSNLFYTMLYTCIVLTDSIHVCMQFSEL